VVEEVLDVHPPAGGEVVDDDDVVVLLCDRNVSARFEPMKPAPPVTM
jgi:hypothetical protein